VKRSSGTDAGKIEGQSSKATGSSGKSFPRLLVVVGPTGTGKSELAMVLAERLDGEIIGCDALQVYRGFDAATAKPSRADLRRIPHHLVDHISPHEPHTMANFVDLARRTIDELHERGKVPVLAGGTGLYLRALLRGIVDVPPTDHALRERLKGMVRKYGASRLHRWLTRLDGESAERLLPGDSQRIVRALELALGGGTTWSQRLEGEGTWQAEEEHYRSLKIGLDMDRARLRERLDRRVDLFFEAGLVEEVQGLLRDGVPETANAFKAIGYREILEALHEGDPPETAAEKIKRNTWRYSKRQRTWFRREPGIVWMDVEAGLEQLVEATLSLWNDDRGLA